MRLPSGDQLGKAAYVCCVTRRLEVSAWTSTTNRSTPPELEAPGDDERRPVRRPRHAIGNRRNARQLPQRAGAIDDPQGCRLHGHRCPDESDPPAVGRPSGARVRHQSTVSQGPLAGPVCSDEPEPSRRGEDELAPVRRPGRLAVAKVVVRQRARSCAVAVHDGDFEVVHLEAGDVTDAPVPPLNVGEGRGLRLAGHLADPLGASGVPDEDLGVRCALEECELPPVGRPRGGRDSVPPLPEEAQVPSVRVEDPQPSFPRVPECDRLPVGCPKNGFGREPAAALFVRTVGVHETGDPKATSCRDEDDSLSPRSPLGKVPRPDEPVVATVGPDNSNVETVLVHQSPTVRGPRRTPTALGDAVEASSVRPNHVDLRPVAPGTAGHGSHDGELGAVSARRRDRRTGPRAPGSSSGTRPIPPTRTAWSVIPPSP